MNRGGKRSMPMAVDGAVKLAKVAVIIHNRDGRIEGFTFEDDLQAMRIDRKGDVVVEENSSAEGSRASSYHFEQ